MVNSSNVSFTDVKKALDNNYKYLMKKPNVVMVGIGYKVKDEKKTKDLCVICSVEEKKYLFQLKMKDIIPEVLDNFVLTDVVKKGKIVSEQDPKRKYRPAPGGVSVGHVSITAGTLGSWIRRDNKYYMLSNNHVLANSNNAAPGDNILQPGKYDGGVFPTDYIGDLEEFITIDFEGSGSNCPFAKIVSAIINFFAKIIGSKSRLKPVKIEAADNLVDAALAAPIDDSIVLDEIIGIGQINGWQEAYLGMKIHKMGRTTGHTYGEIEQVNAIVKVNYGESGVATFVDQIVANDMSAGGDSGSLVLSQDDNKAVGLLFAGSDETTIINRIANVQDVLRFTF